MSSRTEDAEGLRDEAYQERLDLVFSKLPKDGSWISDGDVAEKLVKNKKYNPKKLSKPRLTTRAKGNLERLEEDGRAEKCRSGGLTFWSRVGVDKPPPVPRIKKKNLYDKNSWEVKVLKALRKSVNPASFEQIVDRILGTGSLTNPLDSGTDRDEYEYSIRLAIDQLLFDGQIVENTSKGIKDGTYSEV